MGSVPEFPVRWGIIGPGAIAQDFQPRRRRFAHRQARRRSGRAIRRRQGSPRISRARASSTATRRCSTTPRSRPSTSRRRIPAMPNGRSRRQRPASTCWSKSRWRSPPSRSTRCSTRTARPAPSPAKPSCIACIRRPQKLGRADRVWRDRRGPDDPVELRLPDAALHAGAPAVRQRSRRRRHPGCRRLSGLDGALRSRARPPASPSLDPVKVAGTAHLGQSGIDEWASARAALSRTASSRRSPARSSLDSDNVLRILGTTGRIEVPDFWFAGGNRDGGLGKIDVIRSDGERETISVNETRHLYSFEVDAAGEAIRAGRQEFAWPGMGWADSLGNAPRARQMARRGRPRIRDREAAAAHAHALRPASSRPAARRSPSARIPGLPKTAVAWWRSASRISAPSPPARSCSTPSSRPAAISSTPPSSMARGYTETLLGEWQRTAACASSRSSSARARTRRSAIPT